MRAEVPSWLCRRRWLLLRRIRAALRQAAQAPAGPAARAIGGAAVGGVTHYCMAPAIFIDVVNRTGEEAVTITFYRVDAG